MNDALSESFKERMADVRSAENGGQMDWGMTGRLSVDDKSSRRNNIAPSSICNKISDSQKDAIKRAIRQLNG